MHYRADHPGQLPPTADAIVEGTRLPPGRTIVPDPSFAASSPLTEPVLWITGKVVPDVGALWCALAERFSRSGLWPLVLESLDGADSRPWLEGELDPSSATPINDHDAAAVLAKKWAGCLPEEDAYIEDVLPFGREFPGLASPTSGEAVAIGDVVRELHGRLGLVPATRPADVPALLGWTGPVNHEHDMGKLAAVMRTWEDRFGAHLVGLGFDTMTFAVQRPPADLNVALAIAAEHFAFCPDNIWQGSGSVSEYASHLVGTLAWTFWWD